MNDKLVNGLATSTPLVEFDDSLPLVHVTAAFRTGSLLDPIGKEGVTRVLFRLLRRTAGGRSAEQSDEHVDRLGGHVAGDVSRSVASFHGTSIRRSAPEFIEFFSDVLGRPHFDADELRQVLDESQAELIEHLDSDRSIAQKFWNQELFAGHPYGRLTGGTKASLANISMADVARQYELLFSRPELRLAFSGRIEADEAAHFAEKLSAPLRSSERFPEDPQDPEGPRGRHLLFVDKPERTQTQILIGGLGTHPKDDDHFALHIANTIFGGTFTARLSQEVRAKRGWSYGAYSQLPFDRRRQAFSMWTFPQASDAAACIALELEMLQKFVHEGVSARELSAAKKYLERSHAFSIDTAQKRVGQALDEVLYDLPSHYFSGYIEKIRGATLDEVNAAVRRRLSVENLLIVVVGTHAEIGAAVEKAAGELTGSKKVPFDAVAP